MDNICIPNPTVYKIKYQDSTGDITDRVIVPISQDEFTITGYCYSAHGIRSFKKKNILSITSTSVIHTSH